MTRKEFINKVQEKTPIGEDGRHWNKNDCEIAIDIIIDSIIDILSEKESIKFRNFGTFSIQERDVRKGVNPKTQEAILLPATVVPKFKASKNLKDMVAGK